MIVIQPAYLTALIENIIVTTHGLTDTRGNLRTIGTIDAKALRTAALTALSVATGETVVAGDERIVLDPPRQAAGILQVDVR